MVQKQVWARKTYLLRCDSCRFENKIFVKQPPRKCPKCGKKFENWILTRDGKIVVRVLI